MGNIGWMHTSPGFCRRRVAIAAVDIAGPYHCGGVGAAYHGLALALAEAGHQVTVLYLHHKFHQGDSAQWRDYFAARGIEFVHHPQAPDTSVWYANRKEASLRCFEWLRSQPEFDVIHFHEWLGLPYYSLLAKRQGLAFGNTLLCVGTHGPLRWSQIGDQTLPVRSEDLVVDFLERNSVELADEVISPSQYLLDWMREDGWKLPARTQVINNLLEPLSADPSAEKRGNASPEIRELVFFGRLDRRKGLHIFCDAIDRLLAGEAESREFGITFLGSSVAMDARRSVDYIAGRAHGWRIAPKLLTDFGREQALRYLAEPGRLAVIPSLLDNSPCTVQECLAERIPFIASNRGGILELIDPADRERVTCAPEPARLEDRLRRALDCGHPPARPSAALSGARERWLAWHQEAKAPPPQPPAVGNASPLVTICIAHYERPGMLEVMLDSIRRQTYPNLEVVVVDDGSRTPETQQALRELDRDFASHGWLLLRQENAGPGVARDTAARAGRGEYFLFADDDDALLPEAVERFVQVASQTGADAVSCVLKEFEGEVIPDSDDRIKRLLIPLGPALAAGIYGPEFGGTVYLVKRDCYFAVGGFPRSRDVDEDWEFLLNVVAGEHRLEVIPEGLVWYRVQDESRSRADNRFARNRSRVQIYERLLPPELRDFAALAFSRLSAGYDADSQKRLDRVRQTLEKLHRQRTSAHSGKAPE